MTIAIYRCYPTVFSGEPEPEEHLFSVVADENGVKYATPFNKGLDDSRINMIINMYKSSEIELPTTPEDWAFLALDNMSYIVAVSVDAADYESIEDAVADEVSEAEGAFYIREDVAKLNKDIKDSLEGEK